MVILSIIKVDCKGFRTLAQAVTCCKELSCCFSAEIIPNGDLF